MQRQYSGTAGRTENCQIGTFVAYASARGHALIDRELYMPESWTCDRDRCRAAGIPDEIEFATEPRLHATMVLMQWTTDPASGRDWRDHYPGAGTVDVLAWDVYNHDHSAARGIDVPPADLLDAIVAANTSVGLPFGIAELGSHIAAGDDGSRRATWIRSMNHYLASSGSLWNLWFDLSWSSAPTHRRDPPLSTRPAVRWRSWISSPPLASAPPTS